MHKRFIIRLLGTAVFFSLLVMGFNVLLDPYNIWHVYHKTGVNQLASHEWTSERITKPINFLGKHPDTIFLGSSKTNYALSPAYYEQLTGRSAYNFGVNAARIYELRRFLEFAVQNDPELRHVVLDVSFDMFVERAEPAAWHARSLPGFDEDQLNAPRITWQNFCKTTFSWTACEESWTVLRENAAQPREYRIRQRDGKMTDEYLVNNLYVGGRFNSEQEELLGPLRLFDQSFVSPEKLDELRRIIAICQEHGIELQVVVLPEHAEVLEGYSASNWTVYEDWKRALSMLPARVMDFTSYNALTTEGGTLDPGLMEYMAVQGKYFFNSCHLSTQMGNLVLEWLVGVDDSAIPEGFAVELGPEMMDDYLAGLREQRDAWEANHPERAECVAYFTGFRLEAPAALSGRTVLRGESQVHLDHAAGHPAEAGRVIPVSRHQPFEATGWSVTCHGQRAAAYAVLEGADGRLWYVRMHAARRPDIAAMFQQREAQWDGFTVRTMLDRLPEGEYSMYLYEENRQGVWYGSDVLAVLHVSN